MKTLFSESFFNKFGLLTVGAIYFLIFIGGWVRVTGSGMGCPDWPTCFGQWTPPTDVSELPADYRTLYAAPGKPVAEFNVYHTWTEYINRLVGVLIGIFIAITMVSSFQFRKTEPKITVYAVLSFLLVGFQGWIGKVVVDKNLAGWMVTIHMLLALVVVALVMLAVFRRHRVSFPLAEQATLKNLSLLALLLTLIQIAIGTQVREKVDEVKIQHLGNDWVERAGALLESHVFLTVLLVAVTLLLVWKAWKSFPPGSTLRKVMNATLLFTALQALTGILNRWMDLPAAAQLGHILFGTMIAGGWFYIWMILNKKPGPQGSINTKSENDH